MPTRQGQAKRGAVAMKVLHFQRSRENLLNGSIAPFCDGCKQELCTKAAFSIRLKKPCKKDSNIKTIPNAKCIWDGFCQMAYKKRE